MWVVLTRSFRTAMDCRVFSTMPWILLSIWREKMGRRGREENDGERGRRERRGEGEEEGKYEYLFLTVQII